MLDDILDCTDDGLNEVDTQLKQTGRLEPSLSNDFESLFTDLVGESFVNTLDMSENGGDFVDSDSNDCELMGYLTACKTTTPKPVLNNRETRPHRKCSKFPPDLTLRSLSSPHDNENNKTTLLDRMSNSTPSVPKIDIYELEESGKCTSRNALNARINRMRKKQYISDLEAKVEGLSKENTNIKEKLTINTQKLAEAQKEVAYLRSVISNQNGLMALLNNISNTAGVKLNSSLVFANNNNCEEITQIQSDAITNHAQAGYKRQFQDEMSDRNDSVSVKKTKNGLYLVNEKEDKLVSSLSQKDIPKQLNINYDDVAKDSQEPISPIPDQAYNLNQLQQTTGGVCLHVSKDKVSIELCSHCATSAQNSWEISGDHSYFKPAGSVSM